MSDIRAIDVSSWQHPNGAAIDWAKVKAAGIEAVAIKVTQGTSYVNPYFEGDYNGAREAGLIVAAYHFAQPGVNDADAEAGFFASHVAGLVLDLGLMVDFEQLGSLPAHEAGPWVHAFLDRIGSIGPQTWLYTYPELFDTLVGAPWGFALWIADPDGTFTGKATAVQGKQGAVEGIEGPVDLDTILHARAINPSQPGSGGHPAPVPAPAPKPAPAPAPAPEPAPAPAPVPYAGYPGLPEDIGVLPFGQVLRLHNGLVIERIGAGEVSYINPHDTSGRFASAVTWPEKLSPEETAPDPVTPAEPTSE